MAYLKAQNRWSIWKEILSSVINAGTCTSPALSYIYFHPLSYPSPLFPSFHPLLHYPSLFFPPSLPSSSPLTMILQNSFLAFMSVSAHFAPGRQRIKSSDRQVLVLLVVLSEMARCSAPVSVWCCLHQHAAAYVQNKGAKKEDRYFLWAHLLSTSAKQPFLCVCNTDVCIGYKCVWVMCKRNSLCVPSSPRESGKKWHSLPTSCQALEPFFWIMAAPNSLHSLCKYCSHWHVYWDQSGCVLACRCLWVFHCQTVSIK